MSFIIRGILFLFLASSLCSCTGLGLYHDGKFGHKDTRLMQKLDLSDCNIPYPNLADIED